MNIGQYFSLKIKIGFAKIKNNKNNNNNGGKKKKNIYFQIENFSRNFKYYNIKFILILYYY